MFILGALMLAAGQGAATAAMDGAMSNSVGADEQGWLGGVTQSLTAAMNTAAPLIAGALYVTVSHATPRLRQRMPVAEQRAPYQG